MFNHKLPSDFPMQTLRKKTSPSKFKNDPSRFLGEGMPFRAKLIGVLQVPEARGDRMCQDALSDLKIAIRAAGEHKQRITVHVAIDGLRLREDKTGDTLYHHPVHKISFIAQDMQDSRAFGYIFGSPDQGHRFFGIKTEKAASNVVMAMRDLFQVVFELKKREIELAKQQLEAKSVISIQRQLATITSDIKIKGPLPLSETSTSSTPTAAAREPHTDGSVAELVDLEQELSSLRRGLTQVEGLTPPGDPFGDSFTAPHQPSSQKGLLPPPPPSGSSTRGRSTPSTSSHQSRTVFSPNKTTTATLPIELPSVSAVEFEPAVTASAVDDLEPISVISRENAATSLSYDVFTELDPLGTGKNKPYVDKKLFFQELKNPPKKVLKDLVPTTNTGALTDVLSSTGIEAKAEQFSVPTTMTSMSRHSGGSVTVVKQPQNNYSSSFFANDPFAETDPFDSADPFSDSFKDDPFTNLQDFSKPSLKSEPIQTFTPKNSIKKDLPSYEEFTKNATEAIENYTKSFNYSIKSEVGTFPDFPKSRAIRYDDLSSCSKIRESSIDYKGGEERSLDFSRGKERSLDGRRGEDKLADLKRVDERNLESRRVEKSIDVRRLGESLEGKRGEDMSLEGRPVKERSFDLSRGEERCLDGGRHVFNGPLQVTLPPEPTPKSPRLQRQKPDTSSIRQRPQPTNKLPLNDCASPPPLPPKKTVDLTGGRPPPRPPLDDDSSEGPPLPPPSRKKEPMADRSTKPTLSAAANSSEDEYLSPAPPPLPTGRRFDITLAQLLTCSVEDLEQRLRVPVSTLSSMTLPQLTSYLRTYLAADTDRTHIHVDPTIPVSQPVKHYEEPPIPASPPISISGISTKTLPLPSKNKLHTKSDQFEDDFAPTKESNGTFVANFEDFDKKANSSYDRYAAFREIQEQELKTTSFNNHDETKQNGSHKDDSDKEEILTEVIKEQVERQENRSPLKSLDELTLDSFNMFRKTASPKPSQIDSKIEDVKNVMKNLQIEQSRRSVSPRETVTFSDLKREDRNDRYAALREITITEPQDEFESIPSENQPKERKRSDEKSDGFDNSDFFDCIDNNSSLSYSHVEDAFRKSPSVKEKEVKMLVTPQKEPVVRLVQPQPPPRMSTESFSDMASASSPEIKVTAREEWSISGTRGRRGSPLSSDTSQSSRRRNTRKPRRRQTSSSSRDASPWEEEPPPRPHRTHSHHSRHNSSAGSRECIDSATSRDKDKLRDKRDRDRDSRGSRDSSTRERDRRSSSKERDHRRDRKRGERDRNRDSDKWDRDRNRDYSREKDTKSTREYRSRERGKEHRDRERERDRHRSSQRSWDDEDDYSDGCGSGRSSPRERWSEHSRWRRDDHNYGSLGYRDSRRRNDSRQSEDGSDRRYGSTLSWGSGRRSQSSRKEPERRRAKREDSSRHRSHEARFSTDFSPRDRKNSSPFENEFIETPAPPVATKKRQPYSSLEGTRFAFEEDTTASPLSCSSGRAPPPAGSPSAAPAPAARFRFDSDSLSPKSMFEDDFCLPPTTSPRIRTTSIAEEEENELPPLRPKPTPKDQVTLAHKDIKKSESVNIFVRENDPFENDDFFACTGSDKAARRENWPGDFQPFESV